ncbi:MAG: arginase family protein [Candidatus Aenigmarchaeota archaeon]|nr:arginase family protein [Candidatus Aenigmarchaeota archaeon]
MSLKFICNLFTPEESDVIVFGVPLGKNSKIALNSLRKISDFVEPFDIDKKRNLLENVKIADTGDLKLKKLDEITKKTREIVGKNKVPLILGGGHLLTFFALKAFENVKLIVFDAHCDLKDEYEDEIIKDLDFVKGIKFNPKINDATWLRRTCEFLEPKNIMLVGIRSCDEDEFDFMEKNGISYITPNQIKDNLQEAEEKLKEFTKDSRLYISVDIDAFDPSFAPAVHHPEPNGISFREFSRLINAIDGKIVGLDLTCLRPITDNKVTEFLAIRSVFEVEGKIQEKIGN